MTPEGMLAVLDAEYPQLRNLNRDLRMLVLCQEVVKDAVEEERNKNPEKTFAAIWPLTSAFVSLASFTKRLKADMPSLSLMDLASPLGRPDGFPEIPLINAILIHPCYQGHLSGLWNSNLWDNRRNILPWSYCRSSHTRIGT